MTAIRWLLVLGIVGVVAWWYFGYYDTAAAKCNRGDLGACTVVMAQQAQAEQERQAREAAAEEQRLAKLSYEGACLLVADGYNAAIHMIGPAAQHDCTSFIEADFAGYEWVQGGGADAMYDGYVVCEVESGSQHYTVYDTGMAIIGSEVCEALGS